MNFVAATAGQDSDYTDMIMKNGNRSTQLRQQEYQIRVLQMELCNLKIAAANQPIKVNGYNKTLKPYAHGKKREHCCQRI